jgi:hypothetical protein
MRKKLEENQKTNFTRWSQVIESSPHRMAEVLLSKYREQKTRNLNKHIRFKSVVLACAYLHIDDPKEIATLLLASIHTVKRWLRFWKKAVETNQREGLWLLSKWGKIVTSGTREELKAGLKHLGVTLKDFTGRDDTS